MSHPCRNCERAATLFLCGRCTTELRDMLTGLAIGQELPNGQHGAGWIEHLREAALGQTKLGESGRRTPRYRSRLDGDKSLSSQIELLPGEHWHTIEGPARVGEPWPVKVPADSECDLGKARRDRERAALQHALGSARINLRASELLDYTRSVLVEWIRDICETRGVETPSINGTPELALWLAHHASAIAADEGGAVCYLEIRQIIRDIEHVINRPTPLLPLGACPTQTEGHGRCGFALEGRRGATEIVCPQCHAAYRVQELGSRQLDEIDEYSFTLSELDELIMPAVCLYVPLRTMQHWAATGRLQPTGYTFEGDPKFLVADVRMLKDLKPQTEPTGAAAGKRRCP